VQLRGKAPLVRPSQGRGRPESGDPVRAGEVLLVPTLLRPALREPARGQQGLGLETGAEDAQKIRQHLGGSANMMEPLPEEAQRDAFGYLHEAVLGASRGRMGASCGPAGVAGQAPESNSLEASSFGSFWVSCCVGKIPRQLGFRRGVFSETQKA
jgi:hypothetical protein